MKGLMRIPPNIRRLLPLAPAVLVFAIGVLWYVAPRVSSLARARQEAATLEERATTVRRVAAGGDAGDNLRPLADYERLVATSDRVPDLVEILARLGLDPPNANQARGLLIETGQRSRPDPGAATGAPQVSGGGPERVSLDPRWALFPGALEYTPITVTLEATYDRVGLFLWRLRDLPTLVEVRSLEIARALPLLRVKVVLFAVQRSERAPAGPATAPAPGGPRVADASTGADGPGAARARSGVGNTGGVTPWP